MDRITVNGKPGNSVDMAGLRSIQHRNFNFLTIISPHCCVQSRLFFRFVRLSSAFKTDLFCGFFDLLLRSGVRPHLNPARSLDYRGCCEFPPPPPLSVNGKARSSAKLSFRLFNLFPSSTRFFFGRRRRISHISFSSNNGNARRLSLYYCQIKLSVGFFLEISNHFLRSSNG